MVGFELLFVFLFFLVLFASVGVLVTTPPFQKFKLLEDEKTY